MWNYQLVKISSFSVIRNETHENTYAASPPPHIRSMEMKWELQIRIMFTNCVDILDQIVTSFILGHFTDGPAKFTSLRLRFVNIFRVLNNKWPFIVVVRVWSLQRLGSYFVACVFFSFLFFKLSLWPREKKKTNFIACSILITSIFRWTFAQQVQWLVCANNRTKYADHHKVTPFGQFIQSFRIPAISLFINRSNAHQIRAGISIISIMCNALFKPSYFFFVRSFSFLAHSIRPATRICSSTFMTHLSLASINKLRSKLLNHFFFLSFSLSLVLVHVLILQTNKQIISHSKIQLLSHVNDITTSELLMNGWAIFFL